jgi:hypothetical protein
MVIMNVLPHGRKAPTNKFHPREDLDQGKSVLPGKNHIGTMRRRMSNVARDFRFTPKADMSSAWPGMSAKGQKQTSECVTDDSDLSLL